MIICQCPVGQEWRKWFAWHPVMTEQWEWVWLENVERRLYTAKIPNVVPSSWTIYRRLRVDKYDKWLKKEQKENHIIEKNL